MRIAVIGGGAAGLVAAYLLDPVHEVHVFERQPILGGNVRTLGGNVECSKLEDGVVSENGVSWFPGSAYPNMHRLLNDLQVRQLSRELDSSIYMANGHHCHISTLDCLRSCPWNAPLSEFAELGGAARDIFRMLRTGRFQVGSELAAISLQTYLEEMHPLTAQWLRGAVAASFSLPFHRVGQFPAELIIPLLRSFFSDRHCTFLPDGIFSYMTQILDRFGGAIHTSVPVLSVRRHEDNVSVIFPDGTKEFDAVVIATTPECAFRLLADPSPAESRWLACWQDTTSRTVAHFSETFYEQRRIAVRTTGDCFERADNGIVGCNSCLNDVYGIRSNRQYSFAVQLEDWIEPESVLDTQDHVTALFEIDATTHRHEIRGISGQNHTYYAGAYLFDGTHEGAVTSAMRVAEQLGGRTF